MTFRDLTIRVLGEFSNAEYARLAYEIGLRLRAAGLGDRAVLFTDETITARAMESVFGSPEPLRRSEWLEL